jgi:lipopolysaccharide export system permease protein
VSILFRYVLREFASTWSVVMLALSLMLCGSLFVRALERVADAHLPNAIVPDLLLATFLQSLPIIGALSLVLGIALVIGRLCHDSEFGAMSAAGLGIWRIARPIVWTAMFFAIGIAWLTLDLAPRMATREQELLAAGLRRAQLSAFQPGRFTQLPDSGAVVHVNAIDADGLLQQLVIVQRDGRRLQVTTARHARIVTAEDARSIAIVAFDGMRAEGVPGEGAARLVRFEKLTTHLALGDVRRIRASRDFLPSPDLWASARPQDAAELQWRWSLPLMCAVLVFLALPLAKLQPRQGRYARVFVVVAVFMLYISALIGARDAIARGSLMPVPGMWLVHGVFVAVGVYILLLPSLRARGSLLR